MAAGHTTRKDQFAVGIVVDGRNLGIWDQLTGGEIDSADSIYRPGAMGPPISLGGYVTVGALTVQRLYDIDRDGPQIHWLITRVGKGKVVVSKKSLDTDGNVYGPAMTYTTRLKKVTPPEADSMLADAAMLQLELSPFGTVA
jgi:hypothetical protein